MKENKQMTAKRKRSGISVDRAFRIQSLLKERLESIYREAVHFKLTHEEITDCVNARVFHSVELKRAPYYVSAYLRGYWDAKWNDIYQHLVWVLSLDGELLISKDVDMHTQSEDYLFWMKFGEGNNSSTKKD